MLSLWKGPRYTRLCHIKCGLHRILHKFDRFNSVGRIFRQLVVSYLELCDSLELRAARKRTSRGPRAPPFGMDSPKAAGDSNPDLPYFSNAP